MVDGSVFFQTHYTLALAIISISLYILIIMI